MLQNALHFLVKLSANNERDWFEEHRQEYRAALQEFEDYIAGLIAGISLFDPEIATLKPKDCMFRIYRDVRFSHDKSPYKTHLGAYIAPRGGRKSIYCGYYFHLEPQGSGYLGQSFCSGGLYCPEPNVLKAVRQDVFDYTGEFKAILAEPRFLELFGGLEGPDLKVAPRGFPKDFPDKDLLRYRNYVFMHALSAEQLCDNNLTKYVLPVMQAMKPCNDFLNRAILFMEENGHA